MLKCLGFSEKILKKSGSESVYFFLIFHDVETENKKISGQRRVSSDGRERGGGKRGHDRDILDHPGGDTHGVPILC